MGAEGDDNGDERRKSAPTRASAPPGRRSGRARNELGAPTAVLPRPREKPPLLERYRSFLLKNRLTIHLIEDVLSRLILYTPTRFVSDGHCEDSGVIHPETFYAALSLWGLMNDTVADGAGEGSGTTVGLREEVGDSEPSEAGPGRSVGGLLGAPGAGTVLLALRGALAALECAAPALEISAGSVRRGSPAGGVQMRRRREATARARQMDLLAKLEWVKFACRLGILAANLGREYNRLKAEEEKGIDLDSQVMCAGILQHGGVLCPGECALSAAEEEERLRRMRYVGRRTGRRVIGGGAGFAPMSLRTSGPTNGAGWVDPHWRGRSRSMLSGATARLGLLALGELLHVCRPLYWVRCELSHARHGARSGGGGADPDVCSAGAWLASLAMDVLSHRLTLAATGGGTRSDRSVRWKRGHEKRSSDTDEDLAAPTVEELRRRKARWMLYLLRSPAWNMLTRPAALVVAEGVGRYVPLVGRPIAGYMMELMIYWQRHHFMLEG